MKPEELAAFVADTVEPLRDAIYGNRYRVAAHLSDGTYLPCVVLQSRRARVELALRRFKQYGSEGSQYRSVVEALVTDNSQVAYYELKDVLISEYAWPSEVLKKIHGETTMGSTAFVAEMGDGTMHSYGTSYNFEFFDLPVGYSHSDITNIHSGMIYSKANGLEVFSRKAMSEIHPYREKPFFTCYLKTLDAGG